MLIFSRLLRIVSPISVFLEFSKTWLQLQQFKIQWKISHSVLRECRWLTKCFRDYLKLLNLKFRGIYMFSQFVLGFSDNFRNRKIQFYPTKRSRPVLGRKRRVGCEAENFAFHHVVGVPHFLCVHNYSVRDWLTAMASARAISIALLMLCVREIAP